MDPSLLPPVHIGKDVDYNKDNRTDLDEVRAKVAATFNVSSNRVLLELVEGDFQATILPAPGETEIVGKACIEFDDYQDLQQLLPADYTPVSEALSFDVGKGTGPIVFNRLLPTNKALSKDTVLPRFQAFLAREFQVPADQVEVQVETDAKGTPSLSARLKGTDTWRKLEFVIPDPSRPGVNEERDLVIDAVRDFLKDQGKAFAPNDKPTTVTTTVDVDPYQPLLTPPTLLPPHPATPLILSTGAPAIGTDVGVDHGTEIHAVRAPLTVSTTIPPTKVWTSDPIALTDLDATISDKAKGETLQLEPLPPALEGKLLARRDALIADLTSKLGLKPDDADRIVVKNLGGQLTVTVAPKGTFNQSMQLLTEPWKPEKIVYLKPASLEDATWLNTEVTKSPSNLLVHLGGRSENPNKIDIRLPIPTENGPQWAADRLKETITGAMVGRAQDIVLSFNDDGVLQARNKNSDKVYDVIIHDPYTRDFLYSIARRNPTKWLNTLGESKWQTTADFGVNTGYPNPTGATTFNQSLYSRYHFGSFYTGAGVTMRQGLTDFTDRPGNSPFTWDQFRLDVGIPNYLQGELYLKNSPDGPKFSAGGVKSNITEDWVKNTFVKDLGKGKPYAILTSVGVVGLLTGAGFYLAGRDKETKIDLPLDGTLVDSGKFKMQGGVSGSLNLGGPGSKDVGYTFKAARLGFTENVAPGTVMRQHVEYKQDYDQTKGGNTLNGVFDGTIKYRTSYNLTTSYNTSTGNFVDSRLSLNHSFALGRGMGLNLNAAGSLNGKGDFHDPAFGANWSYQRGQSWNFRAGIGTSQDASGTWHGTASAGVNLRF